MGIRGKNGENGEGGEKERVIKLQSNFALRGAYGVAFARFFSLPQLFRFSSSSFPAMLDIFPHNVFPSLMLLSSQ